MRTSPTMSGSGRRRGMARCRSGGMSRRRGRGRGLGHWRSGTCHQWTGRCGAGISRGPESRWVGVSKMERIRLRQEKVCPLCVWTVGDERRYLVDFHALDYFVHLCDIRLCNSYCAFILYYGCYCCNYIWMPPPGYILDYIITSLYAKKSCNFRVILLDDMVRCQLFFGYHQRALSVSRFWVNMGL